jgi:hypothetical protein
MVIPVLRSTEHRGPLTVWQLDAMADWLLIPTPATKNMAEKPAMSLL